MSNSRQLQHRIRRSAPPVVTVPTSGHIPPGPANPRHGFAHLIHLRDDFLGDVADLKQRYGDCVHYRVGFTSVDQFTHPDQLQEILVTKGRSFRKTDRFHRVLGRWIGNGLLLSDGDRWADQRRFVQQAFHPQLLPQYADTIVARTIEMIDSMGAGDHDFAPTIGRLATQIAGDALFGVDLSDIVDCFVAQIARMQQLAYAGFTPSTRPPSRTVKFAGPVALSDCR